MGGGNYSYDVAKEARSLARNQGGDAFDYSSIQASQASTHGEVHPLLNVYGQHRECMNDQALVVAMDVTRSRGNDAKVVYERLPELIGWLELQGYLPGAALSLAAVGDATVDQAPVQISQWERDNRLDEALTKFWLEEGGGGSGEESYELIAYFYARHTRLRINEEGRKGYFFFIGDEGFYPQVSRAQVARFLGQKIPTDLASEDIFAELQRKFHVFFIFPRKSWQERRADIDAEIAQRVRIKGGQYDDVDVRVSLLWNTRDDLDLHVIAPSGEEIFYGHKQSRCGGALDVDRNVRGEDPKPVENVRWPKGMAPSGEYQVYVQNYAYHEKQRGPVEFTVELEVHGEIQRFEGVISPKLETGRHSDYPVTRFTIQPGTATAPGNPDRYAKYDDAVIRKQWSGVLSEDHVLALEHPEDIIEVIVGAVGLTECKVDLEGYLDALDLQAAAASPESAAVRRRDRRLEVGTALGGLALKQIPVTDVFL